MSPVTCLRRTALVVAIAYLIVPGISVAQGLTGTLIGTVKDEQGAVLTGARVTIRSGALIGGSASLTTNERGQLRFPALPPGLYSLVIEMPGLATLQEDDLLIGAGAVAEYETCACSLGEYGHASNFQRALHKGMILIKDST